MMGFWLGAEEFLDALLRAAQGPGERLLPQRGPNGWRT